MKYDLRVDGKTFKTYENFDEAMRMANLLNGVYDTIPEAGRAVVVGEYNDNRRIHKTI
ncbi:MAG: hypothetical protein ABF768_08035 [Leuconostoc falkenbergense]